MKFSDKELFAFGAIFILVAGLSITYLSTGIRNIKYCGDGVCSDSEVGKCSIDCDWCGDGYCQEDEYCSTCAEYCGGCEADSYCGDGVCNIGECNLGCTKDCSFLECENGVCESEGGENCVTSPNDCKCQEDEKCDSNLKLCVKITCGNGICDAGESYRTCPNDCKGKVYQPGDTSDMNYPIIFVHGHSVAEQDMEYSIKSFNEFQNKLDNDGYYLNKGIVLPSFKKSDLDKGVWNKLDKPISVKTTYYAGTYDKYGSYIGPEDNQHISVYAERLAAVIDNVLYTTGKNKVNIVAHSMGGLVAREYIRKHGTFNVNKIITIGTPNHGIWNDGWNFGCSWVHPGPECQEMQHDSPFIKILNAGDETSGNIGYLTIAGSCAYNGEDYYDEVIRVGSVKLDGAVNKVINRNECSGTGTFHGRLILPSQVSETYNYVVEFLK